MTGGVCLKCCHMFHREALNMCARRIFVIKLVTEMKTQTHPPYYQTRGRKNSLNRYYIQATSFKLCNNLKFAFESKNYKNRKIFIIF